MNSRYEAELELQQNKKSLAENVNTIIRRYKSYFGITPKKNDLDSLFSRDPEIHLAEMMFKTGKNPFLPKYPERDALLSMARTIHMLWYKDYTNKVYSSDDHLIKICGFTITE